MDDPYRPPAEHSEGQTVPKASPRGYLLVFLGFAPYALLVLAEQMVVASGVEIPRSDAFRYTMLVITLASVLFLVVLHAVGCRMLACSKGHQGLIGTMLGLLPVIGVLVCVLLPWRRQKLEPATATDGEAGE